MADIHINLDAKCRRCGKGGATQSGVCLPCFNKALQRGEFDLILEKYKPKSTQQKGDKQ
ncbi:hypothetical protein LCGC14_0845930 [marine sediment metagenome]|uniref:Uncharacterized protein n=1 Tax=marine sediment metagenome TaxID=412755 RepID=A0A0F9PX38_9ZZZZ